MQLAAMHCAPDSQPCEMDVAKHLLWQQQHNVCVTTSAHHTHTMETGCQSDIKLAS
jgi:hypothetical protein